MAQPAEVVDVRALPADLTTVGALARRALEARRRGARLEVRGAGPELRELLALVGLVGLDAVLLGPASAGAGEGSVEVVGQAEVGEERGADEVGDARDPAVTHAEDVDRPRLQPAPGARGLVLGEGG